MTSRASVRVLIAVIIALFLWLGLISGLLAQEPDVKVIDVKDDNFPYVSISAEVSGERTQTANPDPANFKVIEDGLLKESTIVTAEQDTPPKVAVVVAVDVSLLPNDDIETNDKLKQANDNLKNVKSAVKDFIENLGQNSEVAVITFSNKSNVALQLTDISQTVVEAVENMTIDVDGSQTALHGAVNEAINLLNQSTAEYKTIVAITDQRDLTGTTFDPAGLGRDVALHVIGFGDKVKVKNTDERLRNIFGEAYSSVDSAAGLPTKLSAIDHSFPQTFKLTFLSGHSASDERRSFKVIYNGEQGRGSYQARRGDVAITTGLEDGQTVGGVTSFTTTIIAPAPTVLVTHTLGGVLTRVQAISIPTLSLSGPHKFRTEINNWVIPVADEKQELIVGSNKHALEPGEYWLTIKAVDSADNRNQQEVRVRLNVVEPVTVTLDITYEQSSARTVTELMKCWEWRNNRCFWTPTILTYRDQSFESWDSKINIVPQTWTLRNHQVTETVLLNGEPVVTLPITADMYRDLDDISITLQAVDNFGQTDTDSLQIRPPEMQGWVLSGVRGAIVCMGTLVFMLMVVSLVSILKHLLRLQRAQSQKTYYVKVKNLGNVQSRYHLEAGDPAENLEIHFALTDTIEAPPSSSARTDRGTEPASSSPAGQDRASTAGLQAPASSTGSSTGAPSDSPASTAATVANAGKSTLTLANSFARLLQLAGSLIPGSIGASLRAQSQQIGRGQRVARRVTSTSKQVSRNANRFRR